MSRQVAVFALLFTTMLWGFAFAAQSMAMDTMGPLTFSAVRYAFGGLLIVPLAIWEYRRNGRAIAREHWPVIITLCVAFFFGVWLQQAGLTFTTVTNAGFLTSLYVLFTPLLALLVLRQLPHWIVWPCIAMALVGVFLLNGGHLDRLNFGDLLVIGCALCWAVQVLLIGHISKLTGLPITISVICFISTAVFSAIGAGLLETPTLSGIAGGWIAILYSGFFATAVGFTLQAIAQQHIPASNAAIILSAEGLFAALAGAVVLGERLPVIGYFACALIFAAIVLVEVVPAYAKSRRDAAGVT